MTSIPRLERVVLSSGPPGAPDAEAAAVLTGADLLLVRPGVRDDVVVASPHHAPKGVPFLYAGRVADENAGRVALRVGAALGARTVVVCRATSHDPNKVEGAYLDEVLKPPVAILVEIHGHAGVRPPGRRRRARHDVEVSTGSERTQAFAARFAARLRALQEEVAPGRPPPAWETTEAARAVVSSLGVCADWDDIFLRATGTLSLRRARRAGAATLHVETPPAVRLDPEGDGLPAAGRLFADLLAAALADLLEDRA